MITQTTNLGPMPGTCLPQPHSESEPIPQVTVLRPLRGWRLLDVGELWRFRELMLTLAWRDVKVRYKQTVLGALWAILQPAMTMVIFALFFARDAAAAPASAVAYPLFVYAGLLPWFFFSSAVGQGAQSVLGAERLITKVYFPRLVLPFSAAGAAAVDFLVSSCLLVVLMLWYGVAPGPGLFLVPFLAVLVLVAALGVGALLGALHVAYRDFRYVTPFLLQMWMLATPSLYLPEGAESPAPAWLALVNPMTGLIASFRAACLGGPIPWASLGVSAAAAVVAFAVGCIYFHKVEDRFADII